MKKRIFVLGLALLLTLLLGASACAEAATPKYVPGVYEVVTRGMDGKIYFEIEFTEDAIADIRVTKHHETQGLGDVAIEKVIPAILQAQSVEVDGKSGATITSNAIKNAVTQAIELASAAAE